MKAHCKEGVPCTVDDCFYCPNIPRRPIEVNGFNLTELFPNYRIHTAEERDAYTEFIDSFFEEVEIWENGKVHPEIMD